MPTIQWEDSYSVNHSEIDEQHQKWIAIFNDMHTVMLYGSPDKLDAAGRKALQEMVDYAKYHFAFEEDYMKLVGFPTIVEHCRLHKDFDNLIYNYNQEVTENRGLVLNTEILKVLKKWLLNHILVEDKKYSEFVQTKK